MMYQVKKALKTNLNERSKNENDLLENCKDLVQHVNVLDKNRQLAAQHQEIILDDLNSLEAKCKQLSEAILHSECCVVYTGAGISTSASIPDYRGPNGLWTKLDKGEQIKMPDFSQVEPTYSHMALSALMKLDKIKHIVSQNCDGLHVRSGLDRNKLSELHGNCFIEFCPECYHEYIRLFDVTEKSSFRKHSTG
jgi:NAD+-dependent protein deacetylase sirtuin 7